MGRQATFDDLAALLRGHSGEIQKKLHVDRANMSIPTDGKGLRIRVSVPEDSSGDFPDQIEMSLDDGTQLNVPLEVHKDFRPYRPRTK